MQEYLKDIWIKHLDVSHVLLVYQVGISTLIRYMYYVQCICLFVHICIYTYIYTVLYMTVYIHIYIHIIV